MVTEEQISGLRLVEGVFGRCFVISLALLLIWFGIFICPATRGWAYNIHSQWIELEPREFDLLNYGGMGLVKICSWLFFLMPWIGIRLVRGKAEKNSG